MINKSYTFDYHGANIFLHHQPCGSCGTGGIGGNGGSHTTKRMPMERTMSPIPTKGENMEFFWYAPSLYQGLN